jgi:hypothetical protein
VDVLPDRNWYRSAMVDKQAADKAVFLMRSLVEGGVRPDVERLNLEGEEVRGMVARWADLITLSSRKGNKIDHGSKHGRESSVSTTIFHDSHPVTDPVTDPVWPIWASRN